MRTRLDSIKIGQWAEIIEVEGDDVLRRRCLELGMVRGTWIYCERIAPFGDPALFWVRGFRLAFGKGERRRIIVEVGEGNENDSIGGEP